ncbi:MAG: hypothetical protein ACRD72_24405, partial [Candidatus Angelobacter sp.]
DQTALAIGADGFTRVAFIDYANTDTLAYARCTDADCSSPVITAVPNSGNVDDDGTAMVLGADGFARIAYQGEPAPSFNNVMSYARCTDADCSSAVLGIVDKGSSGNDTGYGPSIVLGADGFARMAYAENAGNLKFARLVKEDAGTTASGTQIGTQAAPFGAIFASTLDLQGTATVGGLMPSTTASLSGIHDFVTSNVLSPDTTSGAHNPYNDSVNMTGLGSDGFVKFVYFDNNYQDLHYVSCTNQDCSSKTDTIVASDANELDFPSVVIGNDGFARILYINYNSPQELHFIQCTNADCSAKVDTQLATSNNLYESDLAIGNDGFARIAYADHAAQTFNYIRCTNADCSAATSTTFGSGDPIYLSIARGSDSMAWIAYINSSSQLHYVRCNDNDCSAPVDSQLATNANNYSAISVSSFDGLARLIYKTSTSSAT